MIEIRIKVIFSKLYIFNCQKYICGKFRSFRFNDLFYRSPTHVHTDVRWSLLVLDKESSISVRY